MKWILDKMKKYWKEDEDDSTVVKAEENIPEDLIANAPVTDEVPTSSAVGTTMSLADLPDDAILAELERRKSAKLEEQIAILEAQLKTLKAKRGSQRPDAVVADTTLINPITGKTRRAVPLTAEGKPPKPGTVSKGACSCDNGCYLCNNWR